MSREPQTCLYCFNPSLNPVYVVLLRDCQKMGFSWGAYIIPVTLATHSWEFIKPFLKRNKPAFHTVLDKIKCDWQNPREQLSSTCEKKKSFFFFSRVGIIAKVINSPWCTQSAWRTEIVILRIHKGGINTRDASLFQWHTSFFVGTGLLGHAADSCMGAEAPSRWYLERINDNGSRPCCKIGA